MDEVELSAKQTGISGTEQPSDSAARNQENVSLFRLFAAAEKIDYVLMFVGSVGACLQGAALPVFFLLFGRMIDSLGSLSSDPHRFSSEVSKYALYLVYLGIIVWLSAWTGVACWTQTGERQTARLRIKYLDSVLKKNIQFFDTEAADRNILHHISSDAILVQDAIGDKICHGLCYLSQFFVGFSLGFSLVWQLTLVTLAIVPLIAIAGGAYTIIMTTLSKRGEEAYAEAGKLAEEVFSQVRTVYSFVGEEKAIERYSNSLKNALKLAKKTGMAKGIGIGFTYGLLFCAWGFLLWYASTLVRHGDTNGGKAFTTIINVVYSGFALGQAAPNLAAIAKARAAVASILNMIEDDSNRSKSFDDGIILPKISGKIDFCEICFAYPSRPTMVLDKLSFSVSAGKSLAIVGPSGSGKSTIISMIQRFYNPTSGQILLDGHELGVLNLKWLRSEIGLVSQEPALFAGSIAENIMFGKEGAEMDQIIEAAKASNAHSFIQGLPDGFRTQVGEGGTQLSGGQKQRIAIARAILRDPKILLLDEATSALDAESEFIVQQALNSVMSQRTTIVVAHRLSTIRDVDKIIVLKNGQVVEMGTHIELISTAGEYASLVSLQVSQHKSNPNLDSTCSTQEYTYNDTSQWQFKPVISNNEQLMDNQKLTGQTNVSSPVWELIKLNAPEWPCAILGSLGATLAGMEAPLFALAITHILTVFYSHDDSRIKQEVRKFSFIFIGAAMVTIFVYLLQHYFYNLMGERLIARVRLMMFSAILRNEIGWFDKDENSTGSLASKLATDATLVRSAIADRISTLVQNIALSVTAFVIAFVLCWRISAVVIAAFPVLIAANIAEQLFLKGFGGDYMKSYYQATEVAREAIANIRTVAAFGAEEHITAKFASELNKPRKRTLLRGHVLGFGYGISLFLAYSSYALGLWYASVLIRQNKSEFGDIMKSFMILIITALAIAETLALAPNLVKGSQVVGSVFEILQRKTSIDPDNPSSQIVNNIRGDIEFKNVCFRYPTRPDITIFNDLNLQVSRGRSMAIVGQSGSGKSTLISLLLRFYDPTSGMVLVDNHDIKTLNLKSLRLRIGLVQQEPVLFSTTIYENIKYGNKNASEIEIIKAAEAANAQGFISRMPEGYQTRVGKKGIQLSGGQKQRIAIARAIVKDPSILLLDEATSALDAASEMEVQEAINKVMQGRTTILIAHRLSTVKDADTITVLEKGKAVESGSHEELLRKPGSIYFQLVHLQCDESE
ncbi:Multidrug/pheromone exporter, ABC superfamily [Handroanthus impetiginosus]|uniref:Multidrug/pheromone exporter, ABC superfamily n=1 Tax=Handroanthus impetiginosus TaxID=429701 RepID=A0A2G9GE67_9LAMI|nr:Multidrug/pheromone exporter, ABC superfamily [Handroanthus impetiginosus]